MTENLEVSDGKDFGSLIQKKLDKFEILNFSVRSTGLGDHIELYDKLIKKFEVDYIFLFVTTLAFLGAVDRRQYLKKGLQRPL